MGDVRWSPTSAAKANASPGAILCGAPGSGKTYAMQNMAMNCIAMGDIVVAIDPKNDMPKIHRVFPNVKVIDLINSDPGVLNPFTFLQSYNIQTKKIDYLDQPRLETILQTLLGHDTITPEVCNAVSPILADYVKKAKLGETVTLSNLAEYLRGKPDTNARLIGNKLSSLQDNKVAKLLFDPTGKTKPLTLSNTDSFVISLLGIELPNYELKLEEYTVEDNIAATIVYLITSKLFDMYLNRTNQVHTLFICDEAHVLFGNKSMTNVINQFLLKGRSLKVSTMLASQGITHFPMSIMNSITSKFIFRSSLDEARAFANTFDTSKADMTKCLTEDIIQAIPDLPQGTCFFIDRFNRNGFIKITSNYPPEVFKGEYIKGENFVLT